MKRFWFAVAAGLSTCLLTSARRQLELAGYVVSYDPMNHSSPTPSRGPAGWVESQINRLLRPFGRKLVSIPKAQVIPEIIPDADLYDIPIDFNRLFQPWRSPSAASLLRPEIAANTLLLPQKLYILRQLVRASLPAEGDIFEAGAGSGGSTRVILDELLAVNSNKRIWSLDTFEGYKKVDPAKDGNHLQMAGCRCASFEDVARLLATPNNQVVLIKGLIPGTLSQVGSERFCFAHIDVNLHEPTLAATDFVLDRLSPSGFVLFDDYAWPATYGARTAIDEACQRRGMEVTVVPGSTQAFLLNTGIKKRSVSDVSRQLTSA